MQLEFYATAATAFGLAKRGRPFYSLSATAHDA
jgi:hypothetical protein